MKAYATNSIRNVALVSHQGGGKTSLVEAILFDLGVTNRLGSVADGTTISDFDQEEINRQMSLNTSMIPLEVDGVKVNLLDTPGYTDFQGDVKNAMMVADAALIVVDASAGIEVGTELYWSFADEFALPRMIVLNKMDRENLQVENTMSQMGVSFDMRVVPLQLPIIEGGKFTGVVDLLGLKAYRGVGSQAEEIPAEMADAVEEARLALIEAAAESDDSLLEKYLDSGELSAAEIIDGLKKGFAQNSFAPLIYAAGTGNIGIRPLVDLLVKLVPEPSHGRTFKAVVKGQEGTLQADAKGPLALYVFKTTVDPFVGRLTYFRVISGTLKADSRYFNHVKGEEERFGPLYVMRGKEQNQIDVLNAGDIGAVAKLNHTATGDTVGDKDASVLVAPPAFPRPVYAVAVSPSTQADSAKMGPTLTRVCDEDPTLMWRQDPATKEAVLEGMGDVHITVAINRLATLGVHVDTAVPKVPYQETVTKVGDARYRHKKQTGGAGQFGEVALRVEPRERGSGFEYASEVFGGVISQSFIPSIEKGIRGVMERGVIAGYPVVDVKAVVYDGKEHPVDSKDIAFQIAGREAFKLAFQDAGAVLLEPIMSIRITVPDSNMGDVIGDLSSRRGQVQGTESVGSRSIITAMVPLAEVLRYSNDLRSMTQGRGVYRLDFSHYQPAPSHIAQEIIAQAKREEEEE